MKIEWDPNKARSNLRKHKVSFEEASTALSDIMSVTGADPDHSIGEFRYVTFGISARGRLLVISHACVFRSIQAGIPIHFGHLFRFNSGTLITG
jgi:uncharacterized protein